MAEMTPLATWGDCLPAGTRVGTPLGLVVACSGARPLSWALETPRHPSGPRGRGLSLQDRGQHTWVRTAVGGDRG